MNCEVSPDQFYGKKSSRQEKIEAIIKKENSMDNVSLPHFMNRLLGPTRTWILFKKQDDAIKCALLRRNGLMCFAFEDVNARRMFLVAHPKTFWSFNHNRFFKNCNTYEIIQEYAACKLYLDIEFEYAYNKSVDTDRMMKNLLKIINFNLEFFFGIFCSETDILDLDSSSSTKFSRHVIYQIKNIAFHNSYTVGNFVRHICNELREAYETNLTGTESKINELSEKYHLSSHEILEFFISTEKKNVKLFVDEGVYTKNRHFRCLGSSKQAKNIPLIVSQSNKYRPIKKDSYDCAIFIDSLVTCFSWEVERVLEFNEKSSNKKHKLSCISNRAGRQNDGVNSSVYPEIDSFIYTLIVPNGRIRRKTFFSEKSTILYELQGYRYCENINREHKSNNIKYIVDLKSLEYYQKCYDPDCADFRSNKKPLPTELKFILEDDIIFEESFDSIDKVLAENLLNSCEKSEANISFECEDDVTERELSKMVDCAEAISEVDWQL